MACVSTIVAIMVLATPDNRTDKLGRRSRWVPTSTGKRITLQPRDWLWLEWIHRHGPLPSSFLLEAAKGYGRCPKKATERLGDLFHEAGTAHGGAYLTRPRQQFRTLDSRYQALVYDLSEAGRAALVQRGKWRDQSRGAGGPWLHQFMVAVITASIELAVQASDKLEFIPQADILERSETTLRTEIDYLDPVLDRRVTKTFAPDAVFGFEYLTDQGPRFRFFVLEADRGTEPLQSQNSARKSLLRSFHQYDAYLGDKLYQKHLKLTAPLLPLTVTTSEKRMGNMLEMLGDMPDLQRLALFKHWPAFADPFRVPPPHLELLDQQWLRAAGAPLRIDQV